MSATAPPPPPEQLHLRPATPAERLLCWQRSYPSWGQHFPSADLYLGRELLLGNLPNTGARITYWILSTLPTPAPGDHADPETILAACETLKRRALVKQRDGAVREVWSYGVASVYAHPGHRGKGYAGTMMRRVAQWLDGDEAQAEFSILYSDVGKEFYQQRGGWVPHRSEQIAIPVRAQPAPRIAPQKLVKEDLRALCARDCEVVRESFERRAVAEGAVVRAGVLPVFEMAEWHFCNEEYVGTVVRNRVPQTKGASAHGVFGYWLHDIAKKQLVVLRIGAVREEDWSEEAVGAVLWAAVEEAREWGFTQVVVWNPRAEVVKAGEGMGGELTVRENDSISCIRWKGCREGEVEWDPSEKYCWC